MFKREDNMKKKVLIIISAIILVLAILFIPIPKTYKDGGTKEYSALTYKVVKWNVLEIDEETETSSRFKCTKVYGMPDCWKDYDELLEMAKESSN